MVGAESGSGSFSRWCFEDRFDARQRVGAVVKGARRGRFQARDGVFLAQPDQAQAATVTNFRMRLGGQDLTEQFGSVRTRGIGPVEQPGGSPFQILAVSFGLVFGKRGGAVADEAARVTGHTQAFMKDFDGGGGETDVDLLAGQLVRDAVEVAVGRDMIIEIDLQFAPLTDFITFGGKRPQGRFVEGGKLAGACAFAFAEGLVVERDQKFGNGQVQLIQTEERALAQGGDDPALDHLNGIFHDSLVPWFSRAGWKDGHLIVGGHVVVGGVQIGFVAAGLVDSAFQIVRSQDAGHAAEILEGMDVGRDPARKFLAPGGFGEGVTAVSHGGDEDGSLMDFAGLAVLNGDGRAGVIDEQFFAGVVLLAQGELLSAAPLAVQIAESRIAVSIGLRLFVCVFR